MGTSMGYKFDYDSVHGILRCRFSGDVNNDDLIEFYRTAGRNVGLTRPLIGLTDFSAVTRFDVTAETVRQLAKAAPAMPQMERPRIIVAPADRVFGLARIFEIEGEVTRPNVHVVRTLAEAYAILGITEEPSYTPVEQLESLRTPFSLES